MLNYESMIWFALAAGAVGSFAAYSLASRNLSHLSWLQAIGRKLYQQKMVALKKPPLLQYQRAVEQGNFTTGLTIITTLILVKSIVCGLFGLITVFYLPLAVGTIPALAAEHGDQPGLRRWVASVTAWQLSSHLLAGCVGFSATWLWLSDGISPLNTLDEWPVLTTGFLVGSLITGLVAAWIETTGHFRKGFL